MTHSLCPFDRTQEIGSSLVSFKMIFELPQSEPARFDFHLIQKNPRIQPRHVPTLACLLERDP